MFTKSEIKDFIIKLGKKWLFPDFTNKLTWYVVGIGAVAIATPTPFKLEAYNWMIDTFNLNYGERLRLADFADSSSDKILGGSLIVASLAHNIANRYINYRTVTASQQRVSQADESLFKEFLDTFPSNGCSVDLLSRHDFGGAFNGDDTNELAKFVNYWNLPEKCFINEEIENAKVNLWEKCRFFYSTLGLNSYYIGSGPGRTCIPDQYRGTGERPEHVEAMIDKINGLATECANLHRSFIQETRKKLYS